MTRDDIRLLYEYDRWANRRVLKAASTLSHQQFTRPMSGSFHCVRDTLLHILGGEWIWLAYWRSPPDSPASLSELRARRDAFFSPEAFANVELTSPRLIYYGAYETQFLKRMRARYPDVGSASQLDKLTSSTQNLLSVIYPHVYFPTYTNGLKDVAAYLGFRWSSDSPSGLAALGWRLQWEASREANLKDRLIVYNAEDCEAAERVAAVLAAVSSQESAP